MTRQNLNSLNQIDFEYKIEEIFNENSFSAYPHIRNEIGKQINLGTLSKGIFKTF